MSSNCAKEGEVGQKALTAGWTAWIGRATLALVPLAVLAATGIHVLEQREKQLQQRAAEQLRRFAEEYRRAPVSQDVHRAINERVEDAFAPVYAGIPELLDWHYSFFGQYTELGLALFGRLEGEIESRLFGGLEERIDDALKGVGSVMQEEMLAELEGWFDRDVASLPPGLRTDYEQTLEPILEDARRRFTVSVGPMALGAAMTGGGAAVGVKALATGLAGRLSSGVGAAALRAIGRSIGPAMGIVGGVAGWLAIDFTLREVEEWRGREDLEQALAALVDEEKERVKSALAGAGEDVKARPLGHFIPSELR